MASGVAPTQARLRAASATAAAAPVYGSRYTKRGLQSLVAATPMGLPLTRITAASAAPGTTTVFVMT